MIRRLHRTVGCIQTDDEWLKEHAFYFVADGP
jgi:hypothetical protein